MTQAQVETATGHILATGDFPAGSPDPATIEIVELTAAQETVVFSDEPGQRTIGSDGTVTITPPPPPPIRYVEAQPVSAEVRTTDDVPHEVFRLPTTSKHVYGATFRMMAVDAGTGATKRARAEMTFKGLASSVVQVGSTVTSPPMQDTTASAWVIQPTTDGVDLIISVKGAAGRTVDWTLAGDVEVFAPEGLET